MIALDIETSGVDPQKNSILSLGALDTDEPTNQFYDECRVGEGLHINDESLAINGFSREEATDVSKKTEAELLQAFFAWALDRPKNRTIVGQNTSFDTGFLQAASKRAGIEFPLAHRTLDTHALVWLHMTLYGIEPPMMHEHSALNLTAALAYCGLPPEPKPHNALTGAFVHAEIFSRIAYNKKMIPEFFEYEIPFQGLTLNQG
jgi:DNA polymerase III epsilon subunit-like protein